MKKTIALLSCMAFFFSAHAQSFEIGARYFAISNWFFNKNVSDAGGTQNYSSSYSNTYGLHFAYNFTNHVSIETNVLYGSLAESYNGAFDKDGKLPDGGDPNAITIYKANENYKSTMRINVVQIPLFFRFLSGNGAYAEIGPEFDIITDATYSATYNGGVVSSRNYNIAAYTAGGYVAAVLAFGNNIRLHGPLFLNINLRFTYGLTDIKGVDGLGQNLSNTALYSGNPPYYSSNQATHAVSGGFAVGFIYRFGHDF